MGTLLDWSFFTHIFFFQLQVRAYLAIQIKKKSATIKDLPIWFFGNKGIFVGQNSYGHKSSFLIYFFVFVRSDQKVAPYWLESVTIHKNCLNIVAY